ncbi:MAG: protein-methionine-sulfoxide reductase catalytic subunit MsrP [Pseudomonadota bacterium]|nr:protein-methionine-sulfoxide reductase catalytic subunit MsrP [Pseudomonadota bacterium]
MTFHHRSTPPKPSDITAESTWVNRRQLLQQAGVVGAAGLILPPHLSHAQAASNPTYRPVAERADVPAYLRQKIAARQLARTNPTGEALTPYESATTYNNFYEFGTGKTDPSRHAGTLKLDPWTVTVDGLCDQAGKYTLEDILKPHTLEDRIYRFRCVEAWSMVVPWLGFSLGDLLKRFEPKSTARFVKFTTLLDTQQMPNQRSRDLNWPYVEGLRMDEAMHPLAIMAVGLYGRSLPDQNGAPLRLIVPWKYGFKSIKSIVRITFMESAPITTWLGLAPQEYGFYANVNPAVSHPRWSQARERRLPNTLLNPNWHETLPFNGYASEVAGLYRNMDLRKFY